MTGLRRRAGAILLLVAACVVAGCGGNGDIDNELSLRFIQASPDSPLANFLIDGIRVRTNVDFKGGTPFIVVTPRAYDLAVEAILPGTDELIIDKPATSLAAAMEYTFVVVGKDETGTVQTLDIVNPVEAIPADSARLQFVHAAPDADTVNVYLTEPGDLLSAATPIAQVTYGNDPPDRVLVPAGTYIISVTPTDTTDTVLYDSGELNFGTRADLLLIVVANTTTEQATVPVSVVVNDRFRTDEILDKDLPSNVRVVHASPDAPALDVIGEPATEGAATVSLASGLTFLGNTGYVGVPRDSYLVTGAATSDPDTVLFGLTPLLVAGQSTTVLATGLLASIDDQALADDLRAVYAEGKLRIVDSAPGSGTVDVYVVATGTDVASVDPTYRSFGLRTATNHLGYEPGNYTVTFTVAGEKTILASADVAATAGTVHTVILVDAVRVDASSDGKPPSVLVLDDLAD